MRTAEPPPFYHHVLIPGTKSVYKKKGTLAIKKQEPDQVAGSCFYGSGNPFIRLQRLPLQSLCNNRTPCRHGEKVWVLRIAGISPNLAQPV
jgi:hypothetical protein